jgi:hypothetical protein
VRILTTLAENDYFFGVSALINSVVRHGTYVDKIVIGYRGGLPEWLPALYKTKNGQAFKVNSGLEVELVVLDGSLHMVHEKPKWFKHLTYILEPDADEYFFFDSDIIIINRMSFYGEWVKNGVALCEDINYYISNDNPIRKQWANLATSDGYIIRRELNAYYNSGFLGWTKDTVNFIDDWENCFSILARYSGDMKKFRVHDRSNVVLSANQDSLNLAAMISTAPISTIGPEAMGFRNGFPLMSHPIGHKPWRRKFLQAFLSGHSPRAADLYFWENVNGEGLQAFSMRHVKTKIRIIKLLRGLSRFYSRN